MDCTPQDGYPFILALALEYILSDDSLTVRASATNMTPRAHARLPRRGRPSSTPPRRATAPIPADPVAEQKRPSDPAEVVRDLVEL
jgi:hypothetical protein